LEFDLSNPSVFGEKGPIFATKFSKSGEWLVTASLDGTACVWNVKNKKLHKQYRSHTGKLAGRVLGSCSYVPADCCLDVDWLDDNTFASCGADTMIHIMKIHEGKPVKTLAYVLRSTNHCFLFAKFGVL
jgi:transducin (beta)-like 1